MTLSKKLLSVLIALMTALTMVLPVAAAEDENVPGASADMLSSRVVGYLPSYRTGVVDSIDFSACTHVILSFMLYENGVFQFPFSEADVQKIKTKCDEHGVKLMVALGGWGGFTYSNNPVDTAAERTTLVNQIMGIVDQYNLDGVDIDTEIQDGVYWSNFDAFMSELSGELKTDGKLLTMAVSSWFTDPIANSTYDYFDFINLMSYDYSNSDVAPMSQVKSLIDYYSSRGVSNDRMTIGVPFYGYDANHTAYTYAEIINMSTDANETDFYNGISYNGEATIREKAEMSKDYGGIMIWELGQDSFGEYSLLADIKDVMTDGGNISYTKPVTNLTATASTTTTVNLSWTASSEAVNYQVFQGSELLGTTTSTTYTAVNLSPRTDYSFKVAAVNAAGEVSKKVSVSVTTPAGSAGDYEQWDSSTVYLKDAYVIYEGKVYRAKWYAQGEIPGANDWGAWEYVGDVADEVEESIVISTNAISLKVGETTTISASVVPSGTYTWSTSDASVATIVNGTITGIKAGTATITATSASGQTASCTVTVTSAEVVEPEPEPTRGYYAAFKVDSAMAYHSTFGTAETDSPTITYNKRAYVPMRFASMIVGASCDYYSETKTILLTYPQCKVEFTVNSASITVYDLNDEVITTLPIAEDQVPVSIDGRVYLPARVFSQVSSMSSNTYIYYTTSEEYGDFVIYTDMEATEEEQSTMVAQAGTAIGA